MKPTLTPPPLILSNVNPSRLDQLVALLEATDRRSPFLNPAKELAIVERNPGYLQKIMEELLPSLMPEYEAHPFLLAPQLPHHHPDRMGLAIVYLPSRFDRSQLVKVVSRTKGPDSSVEKITRTLALEKTLSHPYHAGHLSVEDVYALSLLTSTLEDCYALKDQVLAFPSLRFEEEEDFYENLRTLRLGHREFMAQRVYQAIHHSFRWMNGTPELNELRFELRYLTELDHLLNEKGTPQHPERGHHQYSSSKLTKPHTLGNYQIIVIDHRSKPQEIKELELVPQFVDLSLYLNGEAHYHLLRPREAFLKDYC